MLFMELGVTEKMKKNKIFVISLIVISLLLAACEELAPMAESDSNQNFANTGNSRIPVDREVYRVTGKVVGDVDSLVTSGPVQTVYYQYSTATTGYTEGKGFVRLFLYEITPEPVRELVTSEEIAILKTTDTKARALLPGDVVTFVCRAQFEAVAAVLENEVFDPVKLGTWELDYCRLERPAVVVEEGR